MVEAQLLVLLSDVDGVRTKAGERIDIVEDTRELLPHLQSKKSDVGTGGMQSKIEAARQATLAGAHVVIADAKQPEVLTRILSGEPIGTLFVPSGKRLSAKKHWIAFTLRPRGTLILDHGAVQALTEQHRSLLPKGVLGIRGVFARGDAVSLQDTGGNEVGRARVRMGALEALSCIGPHETASEELVHRDELVLW